MVPKIDIGTKVRTVALFIAVINQLLVVFDISPIPFNAEKVEMVASAVVLAVTAVWAWWKDNDITKKTRLKKTETK